MAAANCAKRMRSKDQSLKSHGCKKGHGRALLVKYLVAASMKLHFDWTARF